MPWHMEPPADHCPCLSHMKMSLANLCAHHAGYCCQDVVFRATALDVPLTAAPVVVRLPPSLLTTATDFVLAVVQVCLT